MTEIYLIRHAQAEGNAYRMMQGHWDGGVTSLGKKQIEALAERFKDIKTDALYSSDLYRARMTASAITKYHSLELHTMKELREINVGPWETLFFANLFRDYPEKARQFVFEQDKWYVEGAETYMDVRDRVYPALCAIAEKHPGEAVAVVSHGVAIRCCLSAITGLSLNDTENLPICGNTSVTKLLWDGEKFSVEYFDDCSHIAHLGGGKWHERADLRDESIDPAENASWYMACYEDAWKAAHGSSEGFIGENYLAAAMRHRAADSGSVLRIFNGDEVVGLVDMDTQRGAGEGFGWVSLIYLKPEYRHQGYGIQLLARPMFKYERMGRRALRLHVAESNKAAIGFYEKYGFKALSREKGITGPLLLMEKKLGGSGHEK